MSPLVLIVLGLQTDAGQVICTLYPDETTWLKDPGYAAVATAKPSDGTARCVFEDVPAGTWAVSFIHDVNGNGDMDFGLLGWPKEPWGVSRDAPARFGPPAFDSAAFAHPGPEQTARAR